MLHVLCEVHLGRELGPEYVPVAIRADKETLKQMAEERTRFGAVEWRTHRLQGRDTYDSGGQESTGEEWAIFTVEDA